MRLSAQASNRFDPGWIELDGADASAVGLEAGMVEVTIQGDEAVFRMVGSHRLWALRSEIRIPRGACSRCPA